MQDPIGNFERIRELYISYLDTAFRIGDEDVAAERRKMLREHGTLCSDPLVEPIPRYEWDLVDGRPRTFDDIYRDEEILKGFTEGERRAFIEIVLSGLFPSKLRDADCSASVLTREAKFPPYKHQVDMLVRGMDAGTPGVVTSGTGSGKTEAFLLPLLARISKEAASGWGKPEPHYLKRRWWHGDDGKPYTKLDKKERTVTTYTAIPQNRRPTSRTPLKSPFVPHRAGERRVAAVRALILYPMNALVEDQLVRLRKALDSREAREAMNEHLKCNRIFFGRYTGATPVTGHHDHPGFRWLLAMPKKDVAGEVYFPKHKRANPLTGRVDLLEIRKAEITRRQRQLSKLFDYQVGLEHGQIQSRLHALDQQAQEVLDRELQEAGAVQGTVDSATFFALASTAGRRAADSLLQDFRKWVGRHPNPVEGEHLAENQLSQSDAWVAPSATAVDDSPFIFPSVDGAEMTNRWDMQTDPPDLLITNVSMLSAMLNREVEESIFEQTREWLREPDSYFYLVLDELHLQRGAAGTEVAYLIRLLLQRLGLTESAEQLRKIRILASSASLPASPDEEAKKSAEYLWDMFGPFGLPPGVNAEEGMSMWLASIVGGDERGSVYEDTEPPRADIAPFVRLLEAHTPPGAIDPEFPQAIPLAARVPDGDGEISSAWIAVADALGVGPGPIRERVAASVEAAAARVAWACEERDPITGRARSRATPIAELADKLFREPPGDETTRLQAVRGLLFVRGCGDGLAAYLGEKLDSPPSFRVHTFFRSIEGLYAPASRELGASADSITRKADVGRLTIDQTARVQIQRGDGLEEHRAYELVYCECCGELFVGGMRAQKAPRSLYVAELLPHEPHLEGLPDQSASQRFEDLSWSSYGLFWPAPLDQNSIDDMKDPSDQGSWLPAYLERPSGGVILVDKVAAEAATELLAGWYFARTDKLDHSRHKRGPQTSGTHVPYACPACRTSYVGRSKRYRLSPLRNFRAGFAKTTQLLATELFDSLRVSTPNTPTKLVSFSDSRQDAAKAALSIERFHHQDIRREVLFRTLRETAAAKDAEAARLAFEKAEADLDGTPSAFRTIAQQQVRRLEQKYKREADPNVALLDVLEEEEQALPGVDLRVKPFIAAMVGLGVHPFDDAGQDRALGSESGASMRFPWDRLFRVDDVRQDIYWADDEHHQVAIESARQHVVSGVYELLTDVVFSKTYFSFEEAGLGYVAVSTFDLPQERASDARAQELAAFIRVLADAYRYWPTPYRDSDDRHAPWSSPGELSAKKVRKFVEAAWPGDPNAAIAELLADLGSCGHPDGVIRMNKIRIRLVDCDEPYIRCARCHRVHLHRGVDVCTRCFHPLDWMTTEKEEARSLHTRSFLARRVLRTSTGDSSNENPSFRLHCEELTGQTEDPLSRQREFKGIFLPRLASVEPATDDDDEEGVGLVLSAPDPLFKRKKEIDLLTVTTTMEVGIDIGQLQVVLQANMPPQRFNYQQRVGRAGRRGQAFSMALTICRTKSHDLYYFRHPKKMTGDVPPTPFLTKRMRNIEERFLRKAWLWEAFRSLRKDIRDSGAIYPGDLMSPPDIHGEYVPTSFVATSGTDTDWLASVASAIRTSEEYAGSVCAALNEGSGARPIQRNVEVLIEDISNVLEEARQEGLAHSLAEAGLLPMYGMPTRVRSLYLGLRADGDRAAWSTVDRDLDLAIYEFAPGSTVVIDKREHLAIGFTPDLGEPMPGLGDQKVRAYQDSAFGPPLRLLECGSCGAWTQITEGTGPDECKSCDSKLDPGLAKECRVPHAFRTDLPGFPRTQEDEVDSGVRHRSIQAEGQRLDFSTEVGFGPAEAWRLSVAHKLGRTFRLNRGPMSEDDGRAFEIRSGTDELLYRRRRLQLPCQQISTESRLDARVSKSFQPEGEPERVWLAAPKVTDALYLSSAERNPKLALHRLPGRLDALPQDPGELHETTRWLGVRAAAISASHIVVNRAAFELDIDPEEFDVLEPRLHGKAESRPLIHITDNLVNGAGFCDYLASKDQSGTIRVASYIDSMLRDEDAYPLQEFLAPTHTCDTSCYKCLRRYGNQPFHALLDWQLGLAFLRALVDPSYACGLDGSFDEPSLRAWPNQAERVARDMAKRFGGEEVKNFQGVPGFRVGIGKSKLSPWVLVAHPLWEWRDELRPDSVLAKAREAATEFGEPLCWDTFNLTRRQVFVRERIREEIRRRG